MRSFGFDQRQENSATDTVRVPSLSSMPLPQSEPSSSPQPAAEKPKSAAPADRKIAVLGPTLRFKGELSAEEDFILQGRIEGSINHTQSVTIGTDGAVFNGRIDMTGSAATQTAAAAAIKKRVESPTISPGQPLSAEETEKVLGNK